MFEYQNNQSNNDSKKNMKFQNGVHLSQHLKKKLPVRPINEEDKHSVMK